MACEMSAELGLFNKWLSSKTDLWNSKALLNPGHFLSQLKVAVERITSILWILLVLRKSNVEGSFAFLEGWHTLTTRLGACLRHSSSHCPSRLTDVMITVALSFILARGANITPVAVVVGTPPAYSFHRLRALIWTLTCWAVGHRDGERGSDAIKPSTTQLLPMPTLEQRNPPRTGTPSRLLRNGDLPLEHSTSSMKARDCF
mmetsp:Transcript_26134/g.58091  ORF Transcript_26134/g.58091 Transcript_26134/m.58091 type:complete len:202 (+) Transcript_26134:1020-1625(+)